MPGAGGILAMNAIANVAPRDGLTIAQAMERGELDSFGVVFWSSLTSTTADWIKEKKIRILLQTGPEKEAALPDVPYGPDLVKTADDKKLFEASYAPLAAGRPFVAPPGLPAARAAALRAGLFATFPQFLAEAAKMRLLVNEPVSGEAMQAQIARVYQMPQRVVDRLRRIAHKE